MIGVVAKGGPVEGTRISGVLVTKAFNYVIVDPEELERKRWSTACLFVILHALAVLTVVALLVQRTLG